MIESAPRRTTIRSLRTPHLISTTHYPKHPNVREHSFSYCTRPLHIPRATLDRQRNRLIPLFLCELSGSVRKLFTCAYLCRTSSSNHRSMHVISLSRSTTSSSIPGLFNTAPRLKSRETVFRFQRSFAAALREIKLQYLLTHDHPVFPCSSSPI